MRSRKLTRLVPLLFVAALSPGAGGCSRAPRAARIEIAGQEARLSPMIVGVCSIFMKIENAGNGDDALLGASADLPGAIAELHDVKDGRMFRRDRTPLPANGVLELRPGGAHIMVFNLPKDAGIGYEFTLRLVFEKSGERRTSVRIVG